ncbi:response regulator [bacterium]|nr:response regulator [bacterium]
MDEDRTRVLLVDDEKDFVELLAERLAGRGLTVDTCSTGNEALERSGGGNYDAVVLDLEMPGMDGIETLKKLLAEQPELQVIFLSGRGTLKTGIEAVKEGALEFLEKPADISTLLTHIEEAKTRRIVLVEKRMQDEIADVLRRKGW